MIKRLAHRNANVQLYTLEVESPHQWTEKVDTNGFDKVGECMLSKLRPQNAQGIGFEKLYRRIATACGR